MAKILSCQVYGEYIEGEYIEVVLGHKHETKFLISRFNRFNKYRPNPGSVVKNNSSLCGISKNWRRSWPNINMGTSTVVLRLEWQKSVSSRYVYLPYFLGEWLKDWT